MARHSAPPRFDQNLSDVTEENIVLNVESLIAETGAETIKLETQVLVTSLGAERVDFSHWKTSEGLECP